MCFDIIRVDNYYLSPAADTEHDLPRRVLLIKFPAPGTRARVGIARVMTLELVIEHPGRLPVGVPVRDVDPELLHLLSEVVLVVAERALEEVRPGVLCGLLDAVAMEPAVTAGGPHHRLLLLAVGVLCSKLTLQVNTDRALPYLKLHGATSTLVLLSEHFHLILVFRKKRFLDWLVGLTVRLIITQELLKTSVLQTAGKMVSFPAQLHR